jgi:N-acetylornithine carbamoyltransferase
VPQSLILQMPRFGLDVTLAYPPGFELMPDIVGQAQEQARKFGTAFEITNSMEEGFKDADIVYAKSWGPLLTTADKTEGKKLQDSFKDWITDGAVSGPARYDLHAPLPGSQHQ